MQLCQNQEATACERQSRIVGLSLNYKFNDKTTVRLYNNGCNVVIRMCKMVEPVCCLRIRTLLTMEEEGE